MWLIKLNLRLIALFRGRDWGENATTRLLRINSGPINTVVVGATGARDNSRVTTVGHVQVELKETGLHSVPSAITIIATKTPRRRPRVVYRDEISSALPPRKTCPEIHSLTRRQCQINVRSSQDFSLPLEVTALLRMTGSSRGEQELTMQAGT